ncbi:unnamed protein product [Haemonchus placei]|uniref:Uncharacterized protein n=1 Tax=Haemonchus placei TaxID=6290 RepID=A0A0N4X7E2_HAEPC|nr:unnamed protein product [Haemonchus placei]
MGMADFVCFLTTIPKNPPVEHDLLVVEHSTM